jgi:hypothetical protein
LRQWQLLDDHPLSAAMLRLPLPRAFVLLVVAASCSGSNKGGSPPGTGTDGGSAAGDGAARADGPGGSSGGSSGGGAGGSPGGGAGGSSGGGAGGSSGPMLPPGCALQTIQGERLPIDLYMMIDVSASMLQKTADGPTKWEAVRSALSSFFGEPQSVGIGVGLQFFPRIAAGSTKACLADGDCGAYGPCYGIRTCSGLSYVQLCATAADCQDGRACVPLGYCFAAKDFCTAIGSPCASGADTCAGGSVEGYCLGRDSCTTADYATPAVPVAELPGATAALTAALAAQTPDGYTPTSAALSGALDQARTLAARPSTRKVAVVLATDGLPTTCQPKDIGGVAAIARQAFAATPSIPTFVIGVFAPEEQAAAGNLTQIAQAGGTATPRIVNATRNVAASFLAALDDVRATAVACEIKVPRSSTGDPLDFANVNIRFTSGSGRETTIPGAGSAAGCKPGQQGWYYDIDPTQASPTKILFCDDSCALLKSDPKGRIDLLIGCKTVLIP